MKRRLYVKFLLGYLIFFILAFLVIAFFSAGMTERYLLHDAGERLYTEVSLLADACSAFYGSGNLDLSNAVPRIETVADCMDATAWLMNRQGEIIYDSDQTDTRKQISDFNPADSGQEPYTTGTFYDHFDREMISVYASISGSYRVSGYVVLHQPVSEAIASRDRILNVVYVTGLIIFALSLILLFVFHWIVYRPLRKITVAANRFAEGDLDYRCALRPEDEMGYLADTLNYMASELSKMEEYQRKFISNVSHDFRSPLTSIKGYLEAIMDGTIPPPMHEKYMKLVISETERLTKLTQNTLALQSLESRGTYLELSDFDINQVVKNTAAAFEGACIPKKITFDLTFSARTLMVRADLSKIQQVLYNLIDNAIKFSPNDSIIWLETSERFEKVFVSVRDNGLGIPKDSQKRIWERFYKSDLSRGKDKKGTGLGLAIVKEVIQAHSQTIDVISTVGVGSEFIFSLQKPKDEGRKVSS